MDISAYVKIPLSDRYLMNINAQVYDKNKDRLLKLYFYGGKPRYNLMIRSSTGENMKRQFSPERLLYITFIDKDIGRYDSVMFKNGVRDLRLENLVLSRGGRNDRNTKYFVDHDYFEKIDSKNKAYSLGLMFSDGCVSLTNNNINLVSKDIDLLEFVKKELKLTKDFIPNSVAKHCKNIIFSSSKMKLDLIKLGCVPVKSLILEWPKNLPDEYIGSFILGYFDGDGSIYGRNKSKNGITPLQVKITSSTKFCTSLVKVLNSFGIKTCKITTEKRYKPETSYFRICDLESVYKIKSLMYNDPPDFYLKRKYERFPL